MIQANDLRVNNLLIKHGEIVKVVDIGVKHQTDSNYYLRCEKDNCGYWIDQFEPIPLTEEILLKNSLKIGEKDYLIGDVLFSKFREDLCYSEGLGYKLSVPIIHVHQLQNIIFALTNQEITINL